MIKIPYKQIVISLVTLITLHYTEAQANPFLELKKMLKNQGQSNTSQTSSSTPQPAQTPSSSAQSNPIEDGDDDMVKIGKDEWVETEMSWISDPKVKKETARNAAIMDAFFKQYPDLPINYTHKSYFVRNIQDKKYDLIDQIDIKEKMTPGSNMGQPDPSKDQYSYQAKIKFKSRKLPLDKVLLIIKDSRLIYASSSDSLWDVNLGMQLPKDLNQARAKAIHAAVETYYLTPINTNINYDALVEKVEVIEEKVVYGFPISKVLVTFKKNPGLNVEKMQSEALPGYAEILNSKKNFYQEKAVFLEQTAKIIGLNFDRANLEKIKKEGSTFGNTGIETQLLATQYENEAESGIAKAIKEGTITDDKKKEFDAVNQRRLNNAQTLRSKAQKAAELINAGGRSKQGLNQLAVPFIALTVMQRAYGVASQEEELVKKLNLQLTQKPTSTNVAVDKDAKKKNEDSLGE